MSQNKIPWAEPHFFGNEKSYFNKAIDSLWISGGDYILKLENSIKKKFNSKYAFAVSNGTAAINLAFLAIDLKSGDEIIVPGFGYMAAANVGRLMNLKVKFSDVNRNTFCVDLVSLKKVISAKTKAVVIINTYGNMHDVLSIKKFLKKRDIKLIEDAAESFGSKHCGMYSGTIGDIGTFSFHATKTIVTGEGGMVVTNNKNLANKISLYRSHGVMKERYKHYVHGHNFRLTNMQAAIGCAQFENINKIIMRRKLIYSWYLKYIDKNLFELQYIPKNTNFTPWTFPIYLEQYSRNKLIKNLYRENVETRKGFYSADRLKIFKLKKKLKNSNFLSQNIVCLPLFYRISKKQVKLICKVINSLI
jgi:perosamine synthetase